METSNIFQGDFCVDNAGVGDSLGQEAVADNRDTGDDAIKDETVTRYCS